MPPPLPRKAHLTAAHVRRLIDTGDMRPGDPLPTERELAATLGFGHVTVRRGLSALVDEGLIERRVGRGTFVADRAAPGDTELLSIVIAVQHGITQLPQIGYSLAGVRQVFDESRARLEVVGITSDRDPAEFYAMLRRRQPDGLLYQGLITTPIADTLIDMDIPTVGMGMRLDSDRLPHVRVDVDRLVAELIHEARRFGHESVAMGHWAHTPGDTHRSDFAAAFEAACRRYDLHDARVIQFQAPDVPDPELVDVQPLFDRAPLPTCLIVNDEVMAAAVYRELARRRLRVPEDISLMALIDCAPQAHPVPLTAPSASEDLQARYRLGAQALADTIAGRPLAQRVIDHHSRPIYKASLGPAPVVGR